MHAAVLFGGGIESTVVATFLCRWYGPENVVLLHFLYGQRASEAETLCVEGVSRHLGCSRSQVSLQGVYRDSMSGLLTHDDVDFMPEDGSRPSFVPARNLLLVAAGGCHALSLGIRTLYLCVNGEVPDAAPFYDTKADFIERARAVMRLSSNRDDFDLRAPTLRMTKARLIRAGLRAGAPFQWSMSCFAPIKQSDGGFLPCMQCDPCAVRYMGFLGAGDDAEDPVVSTRLARG